MKQQQLVTPFRFIGYTVLLLMACAIVYAFTMTLIHWSGIAV